jgi:hypothetical protein
LSQGGVRADEFTLSEGGAQFTLSEVVGWLGAKSLARICAQSKFTLSEGWWFAGESGSHFRARLLNADLTPFGAFEMPPLRG